jgi:hypothetical protein
MMNKTQNREAFEKMVNSRIEISVKRNNFHGMLKNLSSMYQVKADKEIKIVRKKNESLLSALNKILYEK